MINQCTSEAGRKKSQTGTACKWYHGFPVSARRDSHPVLDQYLATESMAVTSCAGCHSSEWHYRGNKLQKPLSLLSWGWKSPSWSLPAWPCACPVPLASLGWALGEQRTQPRVMSLFLLPCLCPASTAPAAPPALGRGSLFNIFFVGLLGPGTDQQGLSHQPVAQPGAQLQTLGEHKQHADSQIQKGKHKLGKSKVLFRHKQKQLLTISICLLKLSISLQIAVMPRKGMCSFIT